MSLKKLFDSDRCEKCKTRRGYRYCLRTGKNICWHCCNKMRVDRKCPNSCKYVLKEKENTFGIQANANSQEEFTDLLKQEMDRWIRTPQALFADQIPLQMSETEEGKAQLNKVFQKIVIPEYVPMDYLQRRLKLTDLSYQTKAVSNPEEIAKKYLDTLIEHDWEATIPLLFQAERYDNMDFKKNYLTRLQSQKIIKKMLEYELISTSLSEQKDQALIHFEVNRKNDLTLVMKFANKKWYIRSKIFGKPELFTGENEAAKQIAIMLTRRDFSRAMQLLPKYEKIYVDSADFAYYWSIYYTMHNQKDKARNYLFTAIELDPDFIEAIYNYAFLLHTDNRIEEAEKWYRIILQKEPSDVKTLNNLASILIDQSNWKEAEMLLEKCLKIKPDFEVAQKNFERITEQKEEKNGKI